MSEQPPVFAGTRVRRLTAPNAAKFFVWGGLGILGLMIVFLIVSALNSSAPLDKLLVPGVVIVAFGIAWWIMRSQTRKTLIRLDDIARRTGLQAAATAGLVPGTANLPQVYGALPNGHLGARSDKRVSGGGPFTVIEVSDMRDPQALAQGFAADASQGGVSVLASRFEGGVFRAEIAGVLGQERVADTVAKLAQRLGAPA